MGFLLDANIGSPSAGDFISREAGGDRYPRSDGTLQLSPMPPWSLSHPSAFVTLPMH
jgi:hypothetical protein